MRKEFLSVADAKGRRRTGLFMAEGTKCVLELMASFTPAYVVASAEWLAEHGGAVSCGQIIEASRAELRELSQLTTQGQVIAFFNLPEPEKLPEQEYFKENLVLALDRVQDPGNLGTILRTCDWFGVHTVLASPDTVDAFNPKVVQATMGALAHVKIVYTPLPEILAELGRQGVPVYGTFLDGVNIYSTELSRAGVIVMGNEGNGISPETASCINRRLYIPPFAENAVVESLNVAVATAVTLSTFRAPVLGR